MTIERRHALIGHTHTTDIDHGSISGLGDDDHPQYAALAQNETITGDWTFSGLVYISSGYLEVRNSGESALWLQSTNAAADEEWWGLRATTGGQFAISASNDAGTLYKQAYLANRNGNAFDAIEYGNSTDKPFHNFYGALSITTTGSHINLYESDAGDASDRGLVEVNGNELNLYGYDNSAATWRLFLGGNITTGAITLGASTTISGNLTLGTDGTLTFDEHATSGGTPASGKVVLYAKSDGLLYSKDDAGTETLVSGGSGGGGGGGGVVQADSILLETDFLPGDFTYSSTGAGQCQAHYYSASGGAMSFNSVSDADHPGVMSLSSGASSSSGVIAVGMTDSINTSGRGIILPTSDDLVLDYLIKHSSVSVTTAYWMYGLTDDVDTHANLIRVFLDAGVVKLSVGASSTYSSASFTTEPTADTWHHIQLKCHSTSIRAYMDGVLQATVTTNIPTVALFPIWQAGNNGGLGNVQIHVDAFRMSRTFGTTRSATF